MPSQYNNLFTKNKRDWASVFILLFLLQGKPLKLVSQKRMLPAVRVILSLATMYLYRSTVQGGELLDLPVYTQPSTTSKYLYQNLHGELHQMTSCFWSSIDKLLPSTNVSLFSIATQYTSNHELAVELYMTGANFSVSLTLNGSAYQYTASVSSDMALQQFTGWHKHCFTWTKAESIKWYTDVNGDGNLQLFSQLDLPPAEDSYVNRGGVLIMMQDQDTRGAGLDVTQTAVGEISWINFWDTELEEAEIKALRCQDEGSIVSWATLQQQGEADVNYRAFPCPNDLIPIGKKFSSRKQEMTFCRLTDQRLVNHIQSTTTVSTPAKCVNSCIKNSTCYSTNYQISTGACEINDVIDQDFLADLRTGSDATGYVHFASRECSVQ